MFKTLDQIVALTVSQQGYSQYTCRGVTMGTELHIVNPKKIKQPEILHPEKYLASKFSTQKKYKT